MESLPRRGTRPSALLHLFHDRGVRYGVGLAVVVAIPVAVLFYFQLRSLNDVEQTSAVVLRQLSSDTVDAISKEIEESLKRPHIGTLLRTFQLRTEPLDLEWIEPVFRTGLLENPFLDELWVWSEIAERNANTWYIYDRRNVGASPPPLAERFRPSAERFQAFMPRLREVATERRAIVAFPAVIDGREKYVQVQLRFRGPDRDHVSSLVGFAVDVERLRNQHLPALVQQRLSTVQQPTGFPPLRAGLIDGGGQTIGSGVGETYVDERSFPLIFFDKELLEYAAPYEQRRETWRLRIGYGEQSIAEIVSANTRPQVAMMIMLALGMAGGVFLVAGAAAREVRLAELKSNFVASVSHDLKTPLALIQLFAETLELGRVRNTERAVEYYRIINGEARKLTRLIENLLDFSRMEAGLRPYRLAPSDMGQITQHVLDEMDSQLTQQQFQVTTRVEPDLPRVLVDVDAAQQAIENVLSNAIKYSGDSREIVIDIHRDRRHVAVSVEDFGRGIPKREQKRIFRKFYRVDDQLGGGPQGCGLGLAIVDRTMRSHGGYVHVASEPGRGSTFTLFFPIPAGAVADGALHEAHSGNRGRAADAARPA